jgi:peptidoglycan/xylan/chitin deacetylase (PgdA/CDA1 family)
MEQQREERQKPFWQPDMRLDRLLSLYLFAPLARKRISHRGLQLPILMFHSISDRMTAGIHPYFEVCTSPMIFDRQMRFLYESGYSTITLKEAACAVPREKALPPKPVCITFDDGFRDFLTEAFPTLTKYGFSATVFLPTGFIGKERKTFKNRECLTWEEVRGLHSKGVKFGSHSVNHTRLDELDGDGLKLELQESKKRMEDEIGGHVEMLAYPFAFPEEDKSFVLKLKESVSEAGYQFGVTTMVGRVSAEDNPLFLKRIPVNTFDDVSLLQAKLEGAYDWLHGVQRFWKSTKRRLKNCTLGLSAISPRPSFRKGGNDICG